MTVKYLHYISRIKLVKLLHSLKDFSKGMDTKHEIE